MHHDPPFCEFWPPQTQKPFKFSWFAKFITDGPNLSIPDFVIFIKECLFKKSFTDKPEENLAEPEVGKTWLGPAI